MISSTIWEQLVQTLAEAPTLSYMRGQKVYEGRRYDFEPESLPHIQVEIVSDGETAKDYNNVQDVYLRVNVFAFSAMNFNSLEGNIVGNEVYRGILDINNDIRAVLASSNTLGDTVIDTRPEVTDFDTLEKGNYPIRGMVMPLKILYRQQDGI